MIKCILMFYHSLQSFTCDVAKYSMTRCGIFCCVIYYLHVVNNILGIFHGMEYSLRFFLACVSLLTCSHEHVHMSLLTHLPVNIIAFQKPTMIKTSVLVLRVKPLPSSSNDQTKPLAEFIDSQRWATFARFWGCTFNN